MFVKSECRIAESEYTPEYSSNLLAMPEYDPLFQPGGLDALFEDPDVPNEVFTFDDTSSFGSYETYQTFASPLSNLHPEGSSSPKRRSSNEADTSSWELDSPPSPSKRINLMRVGQSNPYELVALLHHVAESGTLSKSARNARTWVTCASSWYDVSVRNDNFGTGVSPKKDNGHFKSRVKRLLQERTRRSHNRFLRCVNLTTSREALFQLVDASLRAGIEEFDPKWPVDEITDFFWSKRCAGERKTTYHALHSWEPKLQEKIVAEAVNLHQKGCRTSKLLADLFTTFDVQVAILGQCWCSKCSSWGIPTDAFRMTADLSLAFTKVKSSFLAEVIASHIDVGLDASEQGMRVLFGAMSYAPCSWAPLVSQMDFEEFCEITAPLYSKGGSD